MTATSTAIGLASPRELEGRVLRSKAPKERIVEWFIKPAQSFNHKNGFAILLIVLPLYEAHLRAIDEADPGPFGSQQKAMAQLAKDFGLADYRQAATLWALLRNGLLHSLAPNPKAGSQAAFEVVLAEDGPHLRFEGSICFVNACELRDLVVKLVLARIEEWDPSRLRFDFEVYEPNTSAS